MKKLSVIMMMVILLISFTAYAANLNQKREQVKNNVCSTVLSGTLVTIAGTVIGIGDHNGLIVDTGNGQVTIYGIGPERYWEKNKIDKPDIYQLEFSRCYSLDDQICNSPK